MEEADAGVLERKRQAIEIGGLAGLYSVQNSSISSLRPSVAGSEVEVGSNLYATVNASTVHRNLGRDST